MSLDERSGTGFEPIVYKAAFRNIEAPVLLTDTSYTIRDVNQYGLEFLGYARDELLGEPVHVISGNEEELAELIDAVAKGQFWSGNFAAKTKQGGNVYGRGSAGPVTVDGQIRAYFGVFIDTTKQRQYENTAEVLNRLLRHDLRNNLNAAYGNLQMVEAHLENEDAKAHLERGLKRLAQINQQAERARDLRQLLERTHEASNQIVRLDHALNEAVSKVINEYDDARFQFDSFPEVNVIADDLLERALRSVLENAFEHNDTETPEVTLAVDERSDDVLVSVVDDGPGVPDAQKELIFGREEVDPLHHGSGLSLFFTDNVIRSYDGEIWVEDNDPRGAVFRIRLMKP